LTTFLALYRGESVGVSKLVALSAEPSLVADFAARMLRASENPEPDSVLHELEHGRRRALRLIHDEASE
jgi:hypothetical protein